MGIFDSFSKGFNEGRERARRDTTNFPVKLVEPSTGRIVEIEVTEQNENVAQMYLSQLETYAEGLGVQWNIKSKTKFSKLRNYSIFINIFSFI